MYQVKSQTNLFFFYPVSLRSFMSASFDADDTWGDDWVDDDTQTTSTTVIPESNSCVLTRKQSYTLLDPSSLLCLQRVMIEETNEILGVSMGDAAILLRAFGWKKDKLIEEWVQDSEKVRQKVGLKKLLMARSVISVDNKVEYECPVCGDWTKQGDDFAMACNHRFCVECWKNWVKAEMDKGPTVIYSVCPQHNCGETLSDGIFKKFLSHDLYQKYIKYASVGIILIICRFSLESFVTGSSSLKFCPGASCSRVVEYHSSGFSRDVECPCGTTFCFGCEKVAHRPVPCDVALKWLEKNASDSENANWILANTKICPKCKVPIEKNQGCNHMTCKMCKYEFCWLCKGDWSKHGSATGGFYNCNKFAEKKEIEEQKAVDKAANSLQRYLHYYNRFDNHGKAAKIAQNQLAKTEARMKELQEMKGGGFMDVQFLLQAVQTVMSCRHVLQWTYAYGYYLNDKTPQKALFETFQEQLEKFCEHLHGLSEKPLDDLKEIKLRTDVINYTRVTEKYRENIVKAIETNFNDC